MKRVSTIASAAVLFVASVGMAFADDSNSNPPSAPADQGPLAPGKAAGVQQADIFGIPTPVALVGTAIVLGVGIYLLQTDNGNHSATATTGTTPP